MRRLSFVILLAMVLALQSVVAPRVQLWGSRPDWLLILVVFLAMHAPTADAVVVAWIIGLAADLMSIEHTGLLAISYSLVALLVAFLRESLFRYRPLTHFMITLAVGIPLRLAWLIYCRTLYGPMGAIVLNLATHCLWGAAYTAAWAPLLQGILLRLSRPLGLKGPRYNHAGLHRLSQNRV